MSNQPTDWRKAAARMRADLDRADITGRARRLAEFCIKATLGQGRTRVVIPNRQRLCLLLQIGKNHVAEVVAALTSARILHVQESADGWEILVYPDSAMWAVDWIYSREAMTSYIAEVNQAPGQCQGQLLEPLPDLNRTLAEVAANNVGSQNGNPPPKPSLRPVPKTGTPFKALKDSKDKRLLNFESLKGALLAVESQDEARAVEAMRQIFGMEAMSAYGGIWRTNWRANRRKTHRVCAAIVEDMREGKIRTVPIAKAKWYWENFAD